MSETGENSARGSAQLKAARDSGANKKRLSEKAKAFVLHYLTNKNNGKQAAIDAGFSAKTAASKASQLLKDPRIKELIEEFQAERRQEAIISFDERARILSGIARGTLGDFLDAEKGIVSFDSAESQTNNAALSQVQQYAEHDKDGNLLGYITKLRLRDPVAAIGELNKMYGDHAPKQLEARISGTIDAMTEAEAAAELEKLEQEEVELKAGTRKTEPKG